MHMLCPPLFEASRGQSGGMQVDAMFDAVAMRAPDVMVYGNHFDLGMLLWAFARLGYNGSAACQLLEQVSTFGQPVLYTGDLIAISHVLWAFAKIGPSTRSTQAVSYTHLTLPTKA